MEFNNLSAHIGTEVSGVDVKSLSHEDFQTLYTKWLERSVLIVRGQHLNDDELKAFAERFGPLERRPISDSGQDEEEVKQNPYVTVISNIKKNGKRIGGLANKEAKWHSDMTCCSVPPTASLSICVRVDLPTSGGDTHFACQQAACSMQRPANSSSGCERSRLSTTRAIPPWVICARASKRSMTRPPFRVLLTRRFKNVSGNGTRRVVLGTPRSCLCNGLPCRRERIVTRLKCGKYAALPEHCYSHVWSLGDVVIWDNRSVLHRRDGFDDSERRMMRRCQV